MRYDYRCTSCKKVFEVRHGMKENPKIVCACGGKTERLIRFGGEVFTKGYGWLDRSGVKRDRDLHTLLNNDPYAVHRVPGEKSDLAERLRKGGKRKKNPKHFFVKKPLKK